LVARCDIFAALVYRLGTELAFILLVVTLPVTMIGGMALGRKSRTA
jgi:NADH:ubiquinone oxidoreductase subunit 6 (subunit J)